MNIPLDLLLRKRNKSPDVLIENKRLLAKMIWNGTALLETLAIGKRLKMPIEAL